MRQGSPVCMMRGYGSWLVNPSGLAREAIAQGSSDLVESAFTLVACLLEFKGHGQAAQTNSTTIAVLAWRPKLFPACWTLADAGRNHIHPSYRRLVLVPQWNE